MKNIDLTKADNLLAVKNKLEAIFDNKINEAKLKETIDQVDSMNFIECKQLFEGITDTLFDSDEGKKIIRKYAKTIKEDKDLKTLYILSENLKIKTPITDTKVFVMECASFAQTIKNKPDLNRIHKILKEGLLKSGLNSEGIKSIVNENKELNSSINYILTNSKTPKNLHEYTNHVSLIAESLNNNVIKGETENSNIEDLLTIFENENLENWEKGIVEEIVLSALNGVSKENIFEKYKNECITYIEEGIKNTESIETSEHLKRMGEQLSERQFNNDTANEDLLKLAELKQTLITL